MTNILTYIQIKKSPFLPSLQYLLGTGWGLSLMEKSLLPSVSSIRSMSRYWWTPYRLLFGGLLSGHHPTRSSASPIRDGLFIFGDQFYLYHRMYFSKNHEVNKLNIFHMWLRTLTYHTQTGHHSPSVLQSYISCFWLKHRKNVGTDLRDTDRAAKLFLTTESFLLNNSCAADYTHTEGPLHNPEASESTADGAQELPRDK